MGKRGKKLDEKTRTDIIRLSKDYSPRYIAQHLGLHKSTVRRHIEQELETKVAASRSFQKHIDDLTHNLTRIVSTKRSELMDAVFIHFKQENPEYAHLADCHNISKEDPVLEKMELLANSRSFNFCAKCPICQNIKRRLRKSA